MKSKVVDTNVWLRYLVRDNEKQYQQSVHWLRDGELGKFKLVVLTVVVAEVCFVLESFYKKDRDEIAKAWQVILGQRWLRVENRGVIHNMWREYENGLHWVDSYLVAWSREVSGEVLSFDNKLLRRV